VSFFSLFRRGQHYAKTWPLDKRLAPVFIENRIIRATRYAIRIMPPVAILRCAGKSPWAASWARPWLPRCLR
jgi:uncharacterized membrane protein YfbV (UPF0208 family)